MSKVTLNDFGFVRDASLFEIRLKKEQLEAMVCAGDANSCMLLNAMVSSVVLTTNLKVVNHLFLLLVFCIVISGMCGGNFDIFLKFLDGRKLLLSLNYSTSSGIKIKIDTIK